ncbi:hypothetical protein HDU96_009380 [Phlyctochytrium bullatum]|nr:hypothetical protein HDU96_009380 [Phlyctochytrium bullatum]
MHALATVVLLAAAVSAQNSLPTTAAAATTTAAAPAPSSSAVCSAFPAADKYCGFLAPAQSVLKVNEAESLVKGYLPLLGAACPEVRKVNETVPVVFCLGSLGPCNNGGFTLPAVNATTGLPINIADVGTFYNNAKFGNVVPALRALGVKPPCYDLCANAAKSIVTCPALANIISSSADPCAGLPTTDCATSIGPGLLATISASASATTTSAAASAAATTSKSGAVANSAAWAVGAAAAVGAVAVLAL